MGDHGGPVRTSGQQLASRSPPPPSGPSSRSRTETDRTDRSNKRAASFLFLSPRGRGGRKGPPPPVSTSSAARKPTARARAHIGRTSGAHAPQHARSNRAERPRGERHTRSPPRTGAPRGRREGPGVPFEHLVFDAEVTAAAPPLRSHFSGVPPVRSVGSSRARRGQDTTPSNARRRSLFADPVQRAGMGGGGKTARGKTRGENRRRENQTTQSGAQRRREEEEQLARTKKREKVAAARARRTARQWPFLSMELPASVHEMLARSNNKAASPPPLTSALVGGRQVRQHSACPGEWRSVQRSGL